MARNRLAYLQVFLLGLVAYLLLYWFSGPAGLVLLPLTVALLIYVAACEFINSRDRSGPLERPHGRRLQKKNNVKRGAGPMPRNNGREPDVIFAITTAALGALVGFVGSLIATRALTPAHFITYVQQSQPILNTDITPSLYSALYKAIAANTVALPAQPVFVFLTTLLAAAFAFGLGFVPNTFRRYAAWALVALTCLVMVTAVLQLTGEFRQKIAQEPPDFNYAFDGIIYLKTFYVMAHQSFYTALLEANIKDKRRGAKLRNGKIYGFIPSAFYFRTPTVFYFWRFFAFGNAVGILYLGLLAASGIIVLSYLTGRSLTGESGVFLSVAIMPFMITGLIWFNLFFPDWWAALALTAGLLFWIREQYRLAAVSFLLAAAFREVTFIFLLIFLILALVYRKAARLPFAAAAGLFLLVYPFHFLRAQQFIGLQGQEISSITSRLHLLPEKFISTASYMMFPYGYFLWPVYLLPAAAAVVWVWKKRYDLLVLSVLSFVYMTFASSSYWGQHLLPFIIFSAFAVFLLKIDDLGLGPSNE